MFETKDPLDISEYIRFWLGNIGENIITEVDLLRLIQMVIDRDDSFTGCDVTYYSTVEVLKFLIRVGEKGSSGTAGSGEIKSRKEKVGAVEVTTSYETSSAAAAASGWDRVLEDLLNNSSSIGCAITTSEQAGGRTGSVMIGGVSQAEVDRVNNDPDSKNGYSLNSPFRSHLTVNTKLIG